MTNRALISGVAGFIGSNLARRLVNEGWNVTGVDDFSSGRREFIPSIHGFIHDDFASKAVTDAIRAQKFDYVFHLAARPRVSYSCEHPIETHDINVTKALSLLDSCRGNVKRFINTSSSSVYGGADILPTREETIHNPKSPYALQKSIIESYCRLYSELYGLDTVSIRPFNVFGPNQMGDNPYACAVSAWLHAVKHNKPIRSDGDGTQTRDITYVSNVVDVFVKAALHPIPMNGRAFNAGTGSSVSNNDVLAWFKKAYPLVLVETAPWRAGDVMHTRASVESLSLKLNYKPLVDFWTGLGLTHTWAMNSPFF